MQILGTKNQGKRGYKLRQQIGAEISNQTKEISIWGKREYNPRQGLQISAEHKVKCNNYFIFKCLLNSVELP